MSNLEFVRDIGVADVYKADRLAATLIRTASGIEFSYDGDYLTSPGRPVAHSLPLNPQPQLLAGGAVPAFFAGLLPEGRRLVAVQRAVKTSADDELSLLLAVGTDPIGDVAVAASGTIPERGEPLVSVERSFSEIRFADVLGQAGIVDPVALPGVQDKASVKGLSLPIGRSGDRFILKIDPPEHPNIVVNEAYFFDLARSAGIPTAEVVTVTDADGRPGLLVRRFDRVPSRDGPVALECEDACQLMGRWPADKYNLTAEAVTRALAVACDAPIVAARDAFRQLVFAWISGNGDVHAKNLSVLRSVDGEVRVSPAYDLPSTVPYGDSSMALSVGGRTRGISRRRWIEFAEAIKVREAAATKIIDHLLEATSDLIQGISDGALPFDSTTTHDFVSELRNRRRLLTD